jgi:hypothetical protein
MGKPYKVENGIRVYDSGTKLDDKTGKFVSGSPEHRYNTETAHKGHQQRIEKSQQRIGEYVTHALSSIEPDLAVNDIIDATALLWARKAEQAYHNEDHTAYRIVEGLTKVTGLWPEQETSTKPSVNIDIKLAPGEAADVIRYLADGMVEDAEYTENE